MDIDDLKISILGCSTDMSRIASHFKFLVEYFIKVGDNDPIVNLIIG